MEKAKKAHQEARKIVKQGLNPAQARRKEKQKNIATEREEKDKRSRPFENMAIEWIEKQKGDWSNDHANAVLATLRGEAFPFIGSMAVDGITPPDILKVRNV